MNIPFLRSKPSRLLEVEAVVESPLLTQIGVPDAAFYRDQITEIDMDGRGTHVTEVDYGANSVGRQSGHVGCCVVVPLPPHQCPPVTPIREARLRSLV